MKLTKNILRKIIQAEVPVHIRVEEDKDVKIVVAYRIFYHVFDMEETREVAMTTAEIHACEKPQDAIDNLIHYIKRDVEIEMFRHVLKPIEESCALFVDDIPAKITTTIDKQMLFIHPAMHVQYAREGRISHGKVKQWKQEYLK